MTGTNSFVCVVDDDPDIRDIVALVLESNGYRVIVARDGADALAQLRREPGCCCVILLDLMMPGVNGWEFRALQTRDPELSRIPVLVLSGVHQLAAQAKQMQAAAYLQKPVDLDRLLTEVGRHC
jgi:CheY-like chemotaxis protein